MKKAMSTKKYMRLLVAFTMLIAATHCNAGTIVQTFTPSWEAVLEPNNIFSYWRYYSVTPWDSSLGTLLEVSVKTDISGFKENATDDFRAWSTFITDWYSPKYIFAKGFLINAGENQFAATNSITLNTPSELLKWSDTSLYPETVYYFYTETITGAHSVSALTTLTYTYAPTVPEPATALLLLTGVLAMTSVAAKRKLTVHA